MKVALAGGEEGETETKERPVEEAAGVTAVKDVERSSDHSRVTDPKGLEGPRLTESSDAEETLGRKAAVTVTMVPPADVATDGSRDVMVVIWEWTVKVEANSAVGVAGLVRVRVAVPAGRGGRSTVRERLSAVEWAREWAGAGEEGSDTPVT